MERRRHPRFTVGLTWPGLLTHCQDIVVVAGDGPRIRITAAEPIPVQEPITLDLPVAASAIVTVQGHVGDCVPIVDSGAVRHAIRLDIHDGEAAVVPRGSPGVLWRSRSVHVVQISRGGCVVQSERMLPVGSVGRLSATNPRGRSFEDGIRVIWSLMPGGTSVGRTGLELLPIYRTGPSLRDASAALDAGAVY